MESFNMLCPKCQFENPEGSRFCGGCGEKFDLTCPECGVNNPGTCPTGLDVPPCSKNGGKNGGKDGEEIVTIDENGEEIVIIVESENNWSFTSILYYLLLIYGFINAIAVFIAFLGIIITAFRKPSSSVLNKLGNILLSILFTPIYLIKYMLACQKKSN